MPTYCKFETSCKLDETNELISKLSKSSNLQTKELKTVFENNCKRITEPERCKGSDLPSFCTWDDTDSECKRVSRSDLGLDEYGDENLINVESFCNNLSQSKCENKSCKPNEILSESGICVPRPWYDFINCEIEIGQGACPHGRDPNENISKYCLYTCTLDFIDPRKPKETKKNKEEIKQPKELIKLPKEEIKQPKELIKLPKETKEKEETKSPKEVIKVDYSSLKLGEYCKGTEYYSEKLAKDACNKDEECKAIGFHEGMFHVCNSTDTHKSTELAWTKVKL